MAAVGAAAVICLSVLSLHTRSTSRTALAAVVRAFERVSNVHVVKFNPIDGQVTYDLLVSRTLNVASLARRGRAGLVYDLAGRRRGNLETGAIDPLGDSEYAFVNRLMDSALGFTLADVPGDAGWQHVERDDAHEVYELTWTTEASPGRPVEVKHEITIDTSIGLPVSLSLFHRDGLDTGWERQSLMEFEYPTDGDVESLLMDGTLAGMKNRR